MVAQSTRVWNGISGKRLAAVCAFTALAIAGGHARALKIPLTKSGTCPELKRENFPMGDNFTGRYLNTNPNGDITIKNNWGTIQSALTPENSVNCTQVPAGFKLEMWADETDVGTIKSLQNFAFDERGRMWAVETFDYPNVITDPFAGHDRIVILEDTDGDHVMDKHTVFATGLNIPQAIELTPQGVAVAITPHVILYKDANGDDKADGAPQVLYTGFSKGDTHGGIQQLRYGMDNWLYGDVGYNGGTVKTVKFGSGVVRMRMDGSKFESVGASSGGNSSGLGFTEDGQVFNSAATGGGNTHAQHAVVPVQGQSTKEISGYGNKFFPITKDLMQGDQAGGFTAATSQEVYTARLFPQGFWNKATFVTDGTGHLVNTDYLEPVGSTWTTKHDAAAPNIYASSDAWSAPIQVRVGPDGAVWFIDWYTYIYLHNGMGPSGAGSGFEDPALPYRSLRDRTRERIYRVVPADGKVDAMLDLTKATPAQLVAALGHTNMLWRLQAQKQIIKRTVLQADKDAMEAMLLNVCKNSWAKDAANLDGLALHALWTAEGLGLFTAHASVWDPVLKDMLLHPSDAVRMNTAKAMPRTVASAEAIRDQGLLGDANAHVRLWAMIALSEMPKATGITVSAANHNLDNWSKIAYDKAAAGSGIAEGAVTEKPLHGITVAVGHQEAAPLKRDIRFGRIQGGQWLPFPDGGLNAGTLSVYDLHGRVAAHAAFDGSVWSGPITGLNQSMYLFAFHGKDGSVLRGKIGGI